jgi:ubiquinone/menaquinone biosynthesis C-methylase UbiE
MPNRGRGISWQCASAYHHFTSIDEVTRTLAHFLKPGGALLVVDLLNTDDGHRHVHQMIPGDTNYVAHKGGLGEVEIRNAFEYAGFSSFEFNSKALRVQHRGRDAHLFTAKGLKRLGMLPES